MRNEFPFQVQLELRVVGFGVPKIGYCGGSLILDSIVLTAAQCVSDREKELIRDAEEVNVIAGTLYHRKTPSDARSSSSGKLRKIGITFLVKEIRIHPKYFDLGTGELDLTYGAVGK